MKCAGGEDHRLLCSPCALVKSLPGSISHGSQCQHTCVPPKCLVHHQICAVTSSVSTTQLCPAHLTLHCVRSYVQYVSCMCLTTRVLHPSSQQCCGVAWQQARHGAAQPKWCLITLVFAVGCAAQPHHAYHLLLSRQRCAAGSPAASPAGTKAGNLFDTPPPSLWVSTNKGLANRAGALRDCQTSWCPMMMLMLLLLVADSLQHRSHT